MASRLRNRGITRNNNLRRASILPREVTSNLTELLLPSNLVPRLLNTARPLLSKPRTGNKRHTFSNPAMVSLVLLSRAIKVMGLSKDTIRLRNKVIINPLDRAIINPLHLNMPLTGSNNMARRIPLRRPMSHPRHRVSDTDRRNPSTGTPTPTHTLFALP